MTQEYADSSFLLADKGLHDKDVTRSIRTYARKLFAEIAVRIVAFGVDMILILFAMIVLNDHVLNVRGLNENLGTAVWVLIVIAYFTASWVSPLRATPTQWLFRMRVLHESGATLSLRDALIRSVALVVLAGFALFVLQKFFVAPGIWLKIIAVALLLYVPSVTARRQGLHDFLAHSVVVNVRALRADADEQAMREFLADQDPGVRRSSRPPIYKMLIDAVVLAIPVYLVTMGIEVAHQKNIYARTAYAMDEAREMQFLAATWFEASGSWPTTEEELGRPLRHNYPAGGYFQLEEGGVIRIQFEILPELKNGSFLLEPQVKDGEVTWQCRPIGDINRRYLFGDCRD